MEESLNLPWTSSEYEDWIKSFDSKKSQRINEYLERAIIKWHSNFFNFYTNSEYSPQTSETEPNTISSIVFSARGGAAFACDLAGSYLKNNSFEQMKKLNCTVFKNTQIIEYKENTLYIFVSLSGTTPEVVNSFENLIKDYTSQTRNHSKYLPIIIITSKSDSEKYGQDTSIPNIIKSRYYNTLEKYSSSKLDLHIVTLQSDPFYRDTHSIQPYLLFSGIMKSIDQFFSLGKDKDGKDFGMHLIEDINFIKREKKSIEKINASVISASKSIDKKMPHIYCDNISYVIAERAQHVINENAKVLTSVDFISDIQHNHIIPWTVGITCDSVPLLMPSNEEESLKNVRTIENELVNRRHDLDIYTFDFYQQISHDNNKVLFSGLYFSDLLSVRLSILNCVDPSDNNMIYFAKNRFSDRTCSDNWMLNECNMEAKIHRYGDIKIDLAVATSQLNNVTQDLGKFKQEIEEFKKENSERFENFSKTTDEKIDSKNESLERRILQIFSIFVIVITLSVTIITSTISKFEGYLSIEDFDQIIFTVSLAIIIIFILLFLALQVIEKRIELKINDQKKSS